MRDNFTRSTVLETVEELSIIRVSYPLRRPSHEILTRQTRPTTNGQPANPASNPPSTATKPKPQDTPDTTPCAKSQRPLVCPHNRLPVAPTPQRPAPVKDRLRPLAAARAGCPRADTRWLGRPSTGAGGQRAASALSREQPACAVHRKRKARGYNESKKIKGRTRHLVAGSQGSVLGVWGSPAAVSDARRARWYSLAQMVIADGAYAKEGLLVWLLGAFCVALDCVWVRVCSVGALLVGGAQCCVVGGVSSVVGLF